MNTREVILAGVTANPTGEWTTQTARNLFTAHAQHLQSAQALLRDHGSQFVNAFDEVFRTEGFKILQTPIRTPIANTFAERWIASIRRELLDRTIIWNQRQLEQLVRHYIDHHNQHRPHQPLRQRPPTALNKPPDLPPATVTVLRTTRCDGLIHQYRNAARPGATDFPGGTASNNDNRRRAGALLAALCRCLPPVEMCRLRAGSVPRLVVLALLGGGSPAGHLDMAWGRIRATPCRMVRKKIQDVNQAVAFYEGKLNGLAHPPQSLVKAPDSRLRVVLQKAGYSRMHPNILQRLRTALDQAGIDTFPRLDDPGLDRDTRIYFFRSPMPAGLAPSRALFDTERQLEDFLVNNFAALPVFRGLRLRGRQYALGQGQRIDLLCEEKRGGRLVGVELKHHGPDNGLVTQMHRYMTDLIRLANNEGRHLGARGIVITGQPDPDVAADLRTLCSHHGYEVDWHLYRATLKLERAPGWD